MRKQESSIYQNPLPMAFGDPFLLKASDGKYYMYGTGGVSNGFKVYSSDDLVTWTTRVPSIKAAPPTHGPPTVSGHRSVWNRTANTTYGSAPTGRKSHQEQENFRIGEAVADKPHRALSKTCSTNRYSTPGYPIIDANILFDDASGKTYLYYSRCCYKHAVEAKFQHGPKKRAGLTRLRKVGFTAWN